MTTEYDQPSITNPENVDGLTHQQIVDAFNSVINSTSNMVKSWKQAHADLGDSSDVMLAQVRTAVDGNWIGASADAAVTAIARYCDSSSQLDELFDEVSVVVSSVAMTAVMTKSFLPPVVTVTADQTADPEGYDRQTREADTAQAEARRIMQERYIVGFQHQDSKIPTFPPAMSIGSEGHPGTGGPSGPGSAGTPNPSSPGSGTPAETPPAADTPSESSGPEPDETTPAATEPTTSEPTADRDGETQAASTSPTTSSGTPTASTPNITPGTGELGRSGSPSLGGLGGPAGIPGTRAPANGLPAPGTALPPSGATPGSTAPTARGAVPVAAHGAGSGMHGMPGASGRPAGRGDDQEKANKKVSLNHGDHTDELLGVIKYVPPVVGDR
ncbi:hypothetical protein ACFC06_17690 [Nocardia sp. NPDC056064]|uniref:hypothetical protein n=1 Tax=Nocardia sp. NPDC056064 TaxID=3345701 RepID=UPI0035E2DCAC